MYQQRGISMIGWLIVLVLIGSIALITVRIVPVYIEALTVRSVLHALRDDVELASGDRQAIIRSLNKRFDINGVRSINHDDIEILDADGATEVVIDYERRFPLIGNIDGIAHFRSQVMIRP